MNRYERCACHSKVPYHKCCQRFHQGAAPENALLLMRSRYAAYALGLLDYIIDTTHRRHPDYKEDKEAWRNELQRFSSTTRFDGLKIKEFTDGADTASVTFVAYLRQQDQDVSFTEKSFFVKERGKWLYLYGDVN